MEPEPLSNAATLLAGGFGGLVAFIVVFALPELRVLWKNWGTEEAPNFTTGHYVIAGLVGICLLAVGCAGPFFLGQPTEVREAMALGVAAEALFGSALRGVTGI